MHSVVVTPLVVVPGVLLLPPCAGADELVTSTPVVVPEEVLDAAPPVVAPADDELPRVGKDAAWPVVLLPVDERVINVSLSYYKDRQTDRQRKGRKKGA